jgi:hypothetical protein
MARVTVCNDDPHGRAIKVVKINPYTAAIQEAHLLETDNTGDTETTYSQQYELRNGELLIITTAEKDSPGGGT